MTLLSAVMIARDEAANVEPCLESVWGHVEQIVLVDTGSTDGTLEIAEAFAADRGEEDKLTVGRFEWVDDFAAARNHAAGLAAGKWHLWLDLDERVHGLKRLRQQLARVPAATNALSVERVRLTDEQRGAATRLVRAGQFTWEGPTWEVLVPREGAFRIEQVPQGVAFLSHTRSTVRASSTARDLRIATRWWRAEPDSPKAAFAMVAVLAERRWDSKVVGSILQHAETIALGVYLTLALLALALDDVDGALKLARSGLDDPRAIDWPLGARADLESFLLASGRDRGRRDRSYRRSRSRGLDRALGVSLRDWLAKRAA